MEHHVGIDVSLELSSLCVLDATGNVIRETKVASEPEALVALPARPRFDDHSRRPRGGTLVAMVVGRVASRGVRDGVARDAPRQSGAVGHGNQDRSS